MSKINVTSPLMPEFDIYVEKLRQIWDSHWLTNNGRMYAELKEKLEKRMNGFVELFVNGHMALDIAIKALNLKGEVITTPFTFASTTHALTMNGCTPVFCDINPDTYTIDADKIESLITEKTCAIVPVHVYGCVCDVEKIEGIAKKYGLKVIYDAAHAFGESINGVSVGTLGDMSMFSFHATKVFNTVEGGGVTFSDEKYRKEFAAIRQFGMYGKEDAEMLGTNAKMTEFHAAMGLCNLRHVDEEIEKRKQAYDQYVQRLSDVDGIYIYRIPDNLKLNYAYFPVQISKNVFGKSRDEITEILLENGIAPRKYFYPLTSDFSIIRSKYPINETPVAKKVAEEILTLPLYAGLTIDEVNHICDIILEK